MPRLSHLDAQGTANMVDVGDKPVTVRVARAEARIKMAPETLEIAERGDARKGDVLGTARLAGIMAAKRTSDLIPLCHPLPLTKVAVEITPDTELPGYRIAAEVRTLGRTGVEMEALTAASTAALTIYDMLKAADRAMEISDLRVILKEGGKSGRFAR